MNNKIPKIEILRDHDGDWTILSIDDIIIYEGHSLREDILLYYLEKHGHIKYNNYSLEDREIDLNGKEIFYDDCPKWVQSAYDDHKNNLDFEEREGF